MEYLINTNCTWKTPGDRPQLNKQTKYILCQMVIGTMEENRVGKGDRQSWGWLERVFVILNREKSASEEKELRDSSSVSWNLLKPKAPLVRGRVC